jgi:hypothetical protein
MKTCTELDIVLYFYDELAEAERAELEAHLKVCSACREQLAALQKLSAASQFTISDEILLPARRALFAKLRNSSAAPIRQLSPWWSTARLALQTGLAILLIFFGFKLGQQRPTKTIPINDLLTATRTISLKDGTISPHLISIDKISINPADGSVQISYNTMNDVRIEGGGNNPAVKQLLTYALSNRDDLSLRLRAVKALEQLASSTTTLDEIYMNALGEILADEENIGIKLSIIEILARTSAAHSRDLLIRTMLADDSEAVRTHAFKSLTQSQNEFGTLDDVLTTTQTDSNAYIRTKSLQMLKSRKETAL